MRVSTLEWITWFPWITDKWMQESTSGLTSTVWLCILLQPVEFQASRLLVKTVLFQRFFYFCWLLLYIKCGAYWVSWWHRPAYIMWWSCPLSSLLLAHSLLPSPPSQSIALLFYAGYVYLVLQTLALSLWHHIKYKNKTQLSLLKMVLLA